MYIIQKFLENLIKNYCIRPHFDVVYYSAEWVKDMKHGTKLVKLSITLYQSEKIVQINDHGCKIIIWQSDLLNKFQYLIIQKYSPINKSRNRQLEKFIICNARICLKSTARHYKTIKFNIKILLNIHNLQFCGAKNFENLLTFAPPPPPPNPKNGSTSLVQTCTQGILKRCCSAPMYETKPY